MNYRTTIGLLVLLVVAGASAYFLLRGQTATDLAPTDVLERGEGGPIFVAADFPKGDLESITIEKAGQTIAIHREGENWRQTSPIEFPLNSWSASPLLDDALELKYTERMRPKGEKDAGDGLTLEGAGLNPPAAVITYQFAGPAKLQQVIKLGRKSISGKAYLQRGNDPRIYVVNDTLHRIVLDQQVNEWRKRSLEGPKEGNLKRLELRKGISGVTLVKSDGQWTLDAPNAGRADVETVRELMKAIDSIYVDKFVAESPKSLAPYGLDYPKLRMTVTFADDKTRVFSIGGTTDLSSDAKHYATWDSGAADSAVVFTISKTEADKFDKTVDQLRDARITPVDKVAVTAMTITQGRSAIKLEKGADGWQFARDSQPFAGDPDSIDKLVAAVTSAKAKSYVPNVEVKIPHELEVTLTATGRAEPEVLRIFAADKQSKRRMVLRNNETTGYLVPGDELAGLFEPALALRDRRILDLPRNSINLVQLKLPDGRTLRFTRTVNADDPKQEPGAWQLAGATKFETSALQSLLFELAPVKADAWITSAERPLSQLHEITLGAVDGKTSVLTVDAKDRLAALAGLDPVFRVSEALTKKLTVEFEDRTVLDAELEQLKQVTVTKAGEVIKLSRNADQQYVAQPAVTLDQAAVGALFDELAGLRVERYRPDVRLAGAEVTLKIDVARADGKQHTLLLSNKDGANLLLMLDGKGYEVSEDTSKKLRAQLLSADSK